MLSETDKILVKRLINHDEKALLLFYRKYKKQLFKFIKNRVDNHSDAEEVLQDSFMSFLESLRDFRGNSSLKTFLYAIAKRKAIDKLRRKKVKKILFSRLPENVVNSLNAIIIDSELDRVILSRKIENIFERLPHDYATVLRLKYRDGYKVAEIAVKLKISFKSAESLIFRARRAFVHLYNST